jgi:hypothetical protein
MTIEEKFEKLTERHQALAETVELMAAEGQRQSERIGSVITAINQDAENIRRLANIAEAHERRLDRIEDRP